VLLFNCFDQYDLSVLFGFTYPIEFLIGIFFTIRLDFTAKLPVISWLITHSAFFYAMLCFTLVLEVTAFLTSTSSVHMSTILYAFAVGAITISFFIRHLVLTIGYPK